MAQVHQPRIAGREAELHALMQNRSAIWLKNTNLKIETIASGFGCALHMHQPTIPAGEQGDLISHLQYMVEHPEEGDNHNAEPFAQCYRRMADLIPQLIEEGCHPRIMLDYSGNLLWGIHQMGRSDIVEALRYLTCDFKMQSHVEWLGTFWSHAVASSTPIPDLKLQISAWQHQFAHLFGDDALKRVKGFSPPEMHLPNHPDTLYAFISALNECGYDWIMVQEHSVENPDGSSLSQNQKHIPNRLVARNSTGQVASITALIKTQGSDTKLVGQMQPYYEAITLQKQSLGKKSVPSVVIQIADGENGGVMMNEFPRAFQQAHHRVNEKQRTESNNNQTVAINGSEWIELLEQYGIVEKDYPVIQAIHQHRLWQKIGSDSPTNNEAVLAAIESLIKEDDDFSMEGASWTNNLSWVDGYETVLQRMNELSAAFHQRFDREIMNNPSTTKTKDYQEALLHLLLLETSCFRYWGHGAWTEYAREIHSRGLKTLRSEIS